MKKLQNIGSNVPIERRKSPRLIDSFKYHASTDKETVIDEKVSRKAISKLSSVILETEKTLKVVSPMRPDSTRATQVDIVTVLNKFLGKQLDSSGKMAVIQSVSGRQLSFNKYSGICEWANSQFLFVNGMNTLSLS
jgi:hypothetical protein